MIAITRDELKELIKDAIREVFAETGIPRATSREPTLLTVAQVASIDRVHIKTVYKRLLLGKIPGAKQHGRTWRINRQVFERQRGLTPGTMPIP